MKRTIGRQHGISYASQMYRVLRSIAERYSHPATPCKSFVGELMNGKSVYLKPFTITVTKPESADSSCGMQGSHRGTPRNQFTPKYLAVRPSAGYLAGELIRHLDFWVTTIYGEIRGMRPQLFLQESQPLRAMASVSSFPATASLATLTCLKLAEQMTSWRRSSPESVSKPTVGSA